MFGEIIHELTSAAIPATIPGIRSVHAVDAAGVHPLLLAIGSERYVPFQTVSQPQEILTQANAILGQGQLSLAKYLFIAAGNEHPNLTRETSQRFSSLCSSDSIRRAMSTSTPARRSTRSITPAVR